MLRYSNPSVPVHHTQSVLYVHLISIHSLLGIPHLEKIQCHSLSGVCVHITNSPYSMDSGSGAIGGCREGVGVT